MKTTLLLCLALPTLAQAQSTCDELVIERFTYAPFDTGMHVYLRNTGNGFASYPYFDLVNEQADTVAEGSVFFFGIAPGMVQLHQLTYSGDVPASPFTGDLVLHYLGSLTDTLCVYHLENEDLCPPEACVPLQTYVYTQGWSQNAEIPWQVTNAEQDTLAEGTLELSEQGENYVTNDLCLPPGAYDLHIQWPSPNGTALTYGLTQQLYESDGPTGVLSPGGSLVTPFTYYAPCFDPVQAVAQHTVDPITWRMDGRTLWLDLPAERPLSSVLITDAVGRPVRTARISGTSTAIDLHGLAQGTYVITAANATGPLRAQRFFLH